ncbi:NAD(P)-binding protein [Arthrobacter sp. JCM 19049]|nr:NAD(P)-binding protein [Arthrobacter sp. JCM 19049]
MAGLLARTGHRVTLLEQGQQLGGRAGRLQREASDLIPDPPGT